MKTYLGLTLVFLILLADCHGQGESLTDLVNKVYGRNKTTNDKNGGTWSSSTKKPIDLNPHQGGGNEGTDCTCVSMFLCNDNNTVNTNGEGIIDIRITDGQCDNYLERCCGPKSIIDVPVKPTPKPEKSSGCGIRNPNGVGFRIVGDNDNEAQFGEFPWMVAVLREEMIEGNTDPLNVYQCGGALIHPEVVVTAAHCILDKDKNYKVRAGEWDTQTKSEILPHQDRQVVSIIKHKDFYSGALYNDVALLFLDSPVKMAENVNVACLPKANAKFDNSRCVATGWGKDVFGKEGTYQVILKKIEMPVVPRKKCQESLRKTRLGEHFILHSSFICAGGEKGKDTCKGDGGSPLVCPIKGQKDKYAHAGIVAWGIGCGENGTPGVYVDVAQFVDWIDEELTKKNIKERPYLY